MEDVNCLMKHSSFQRRSQFDNLENQRSSSGDRLRPDERSVGPAHTLILLSNPALESLL